MYIRNNLGYSLNNNEYYLETDLKKLNKLFKEANLIETVDCCHLIKNNKVLILKDKKIKNNGKFFKYSYIYNIDIKDTNIKLKLLKKFFYLENLKNLLIIFFTSTNNNFFLLNKKDYEFIKNFFDFLFDKKFFKELNTNKNLKFSFVYPTKYFFIKNPKIIKNKDIKDFLSGKKIIFHKNLKFLFYRFTGTIFICNEDKKIEIKFTKNLYKLKFLKNELEMLKQENLFTIYEELFKYLLYLYYKETLDFIQNINFNNKEIEKIFLIDYLSNIIENEIMKNKKTNIIKQYKKFIKILNIIGIDDGEINLQIFKSKYKILKNKIYNQINQRNIIQFYQ